MAKEISEQPAEEKPQDEKENKKKGKADKENKKSKDKDKKNKKEKKEKVGFFQKKHPRLKKIAGILIAIALLATMILWKLNIDPVASYMNGLFAGKQDTAQNAADTDTGKVVIAEDEPPADSATLDQASTTPPQYAGADKLAEVYSNMKAQAAADALVQLPPDQAVEILLNMDEWHSGIILSKMNAADAAGLTDQMNQRMNTLETTSPKAINVPDQDWQTN